VRDVQPGEMLAFVSYEHMVQHADRRSQDLQDVMLYAT
jgi:hypothetical protein